MAIRDYHAAWDFARLGLGAVAVGNSMRVTGAVTASVGFATGLYTHGYVTYTDGTTTVGSFADAVQTLSGLTVTYSATTMQYTIANAGIFAVNWSGALGLAMADMLGFSSGALGGAVTYTSNLRPKYLIRAVMPGQSDVEEEYRPGGRMSYAESASGAPYSIGPYSLPTYSEWSQPMEKRTGPTDAEWTASKGVAGAPVRILDAPATFTKVAWSWEHFFNHCSSVLPFALLDDTDPAATRFERGWRMRGEKEAFHPVRPTRDWAELETIPFACILRSAATQV